MHIHSMTPVNAFVSPTDQPESSVAGTATMPIFANLPAIQVVKLAASRVFRCYITTPTFFLQKNFQGCLRGRNINYINGMTSFKFLCVLAQGEHNDNT